MAACSPALSGTAGFSHSSDPVRISSAGPQLSKVALAKHCLPMCGACDVVLQSGRPHAAPRDAFVGRLLPWDSEAARASAEIRARRRRSGLPISLADAQIAGIAKSNGHAIATLNIRDFEGSGGLPFTDGVGD